MVPTHPSLDIRPSALVRWGVLVLTSACVLLGSSVPASSAESASTLGPGPGGLNLLLGDWAVTAKIRVSPIATLDGEGTMRVAWDEAGETLLAEMEIEFPRFAVNGTTRRNWDEAAERWLVSWHPTGPGQNDVLDIEGRLVAGRFLEIDTGRDEYGAYIGRLVIEVVSPDLLSVRKDQLYDDGTLLPGIWAYEARRLVDE